jgi:hypothetical protein
MSVLYLTAGVIAAGLFVLLVVALVIPESFS